MKVIYDGCTPVGVFTQGAYRELTPDECILSIDGEPVAIATIHWKEMEDISLTGRITVTKEMEDFFHGITGGKYG